MPYPQQGNHVFIQSKGTVALLPSAVIMCCFPLPPMHLQPTTKTAALRGNATACSTWAAGHREQQGRQKQPFSCSTLCVGRFQSNGVHTVNRSLASSAPLQLAPPQCFHSPTSQQEHRALHRLFASSKLLRTVNILQAHIPS